MQQLSVNAYHADWRPEISILRAIIVVIGRNRAESLDWFSGIREFGNSGGILLR
jgi:hypothetical protein